MSKNQTLRADEQKNNYALCSVDMTKYIGDNKFEVQDIELIKHCITFDNEIGHEVTHLISVLNQTNDIETIHLDGDYRTLVPMKFIDKGLNFDEFEKYLIEFLKKELGLTMKARVVTRASFIGWLTCISAVLLPHVLCRSTTANALPNRQMAIASVFSSSSKKKGTTLSAPKLIRNKLFNPNMNKQDILKLIIKSSDYSS